MLRVNPFDFMLSGESLSLPMCYMEPLSVALDPYRNDLQVGEPVKQYSRSLAASTQWNPLSFLSALNRQIFQTFHHVIRPEGPPWASDLTLNRSEGSCRDLAILFCDVCRGMGIAARFVSGYECSAAGNPESYMHAWAEVYFPGAGWRGYDPSRGLAVTNTHVAVAAGFDHNLASPVAGLFCGGPGARMEASLRMQVEPDSTA
jgi:transglutaminase-like putative cysteine protease